MDRSFVTDGVKHEEYVRAHCRPPRGRFQRGAGIRIKKAGLGECWMRFCGRGIPQVRMMCVCVRIPLSPPPRSLQQQGTRNSSGCVLFG